METDILWIEGGRVIDPANGRDAVGEVYARDGKIVSHLTAEERARATRVDARGLIVCPGLVDIHVHFREPGQTHKESIATGSRAAAAGGFTTVVCMPNTSPVADNPGTIQRIKDSVERSAVVNVYPTGCITIGMQGEQLAPIGSLNQAGVVAITDDGLCVQNNELMRRALEYAKMFGLTIMDHCQDASLTMGAVMNEGEWSLRLGLTGWPNAAEDIIVSRNAILAGYTGAHVHNQHISSRNSVYIIERAKKRGIPISGEATPHHLGFTDACIDGYKTDFKMNPPLRTESDRQAVIEGIVTGALDCISTDHAPHTSTEKNCEFAYAPFGIIGLETSLGASLEVLVGGNYCDVSHVIACMTHKPAELLGLPAGTLSEGVAADITLFAENERWVVEPERFESRSRNCPWNGMELRGKVRATYVGGRQVWDGNRILGDAES